MVEIEFSVMEAAPGNANYLLPLLKRFEEERNIHVNLSGINWTRGWEEIVKFGIYGHGPDVSGVGTTWIGSLASMRTLRPFTAQNIRTLGGEKAFFEAVWQTGFLPNDQNLWAVPWLGDAMMIYFWEDILKKAGIEDTRAAFATDTALKATLQKLHEGNYRYPLDSNVVNNSIVLNEAAHWIWSAGGQFISEDGRKIAFNQPKALEGWKNYFSLRPFISPKLLGEIHTGDLFNAGEAVIHFAGPWLGLESPQREEWSGRQLGIAPMPGTAFAGGTSLVIWEYTPHPDEAFELVRFLSSQPVHEPTSPYDHQVPTRREAIKSPLMQNDVFHRAYLESIQRAQSFPTMRLWGSIEEKLMATIANIWTELYADPNQDLDACLHEHLDPLAQRLNVVLAN